MVYQVVTDEVVTEARETQRQSKNKQCSTPAMQEPDVMQEPDTIQDPPDQKTEHLYSQVELYSELYPCQSKSRNMSEIEEQQTLASNKYSPLRVCTQSLNSPNNEPSTESLSTNNKPSTEFLSSLDDNAPESHPEIPKTAKKSSRDTSYV